MKFWKSKEQRRADADNARQQLLDGVREKMDAALKLEDPADKVAQLDEIRKQVAVIENITETAISKSGAGKISLPYFGITLPALGAAGAACVFFALNPALMLLVMVPAAIGGLAAGEKRREGFIERQKGEMQPFLDQLAGARSAVETATEKAVSDNIRTLAASEKFEALQALPGLRDHFIKALKNTLRQPAAPEVTPPKNDKNGFRI